MKMLCGPTRDKIQACGTGFAVPLPRVGERLGTKTCGGCGDRCSERDASVACVAAFATPSVLVAA